MLSERSPKCWQACPGCYRRTIACHEYYISIYLFLDDASDSQNGEPDVNSVGWASWAWSMVPQVLPEGEEEQADEEAGDGNEQSEAHTPQKPVFDISFYNKKASFVIKVC